MYQCIKCKKKIFENSKNCQIQKNCPLPILKIKKKRETGGGILIFSKNNKKASLKNYNVNNIKIFYKNYLNWLYKTFKTNNSFLRKQIFEGINLKKKQKILITGCGLGHDIIHLIKNINNSTKIYAQDYSKDLIHECYKKIKRKKLYFNISNAMNLPFKDNVFDVVFHFGGINLFGSIKKSILEMHRVAKNNGIIRFGDEGVGSWLRKTEYSDMVINNNALWKKYAPINKIPFHSKNVEVKWILENCFYLITYRKNIKFPQINPHVKHKSPRGGSMYSRYINLVNKKSC
jgi:ubiquinone/menaquinone biosynthesis C-methylase UbiE